MPKAGQGHCRMQVPTRQTPLADLTAQKPRCSCFSLMISTMLLMGVLTRSHPGSWRVKLHLSVMLRTLDVQSHSQRLLLFALRHPCCMNMSLQQVNVSWTSYCLACLC